MPLLKRCSTRAMSRNIGRCRHEGRPAAQCAAIAYSVLKRACGVKTKKRMTPKQIVARRRKRR